MSADAKPRQSTSRSGPIGMVDLCKHGTVGHCRDCLKAERDRLRRAIETHRAQRGPFAVWKGDRKLWAVLDEEGS